MNFERIKKLAALHNNAEIWDVKPGQEVEIHEEIKDGNNTRTWRFKGLIIKVKHPNLHTGTFTVRGKVLGVTVEKVYPLNSTSIKKIILLDEKKIRRAKLYFIREKIGKAARLKSLLQGERSSERGKEIQKRPIIANTQKETQEQAA
jgi:large subunit ribosomal protein L19